MTTVSERDRCLEIERGISRLLSSPNDGGTPCTEQPPTEDPNRHGTRIPPADEMFLPLRRPFRVRKRERKKNAICVENEKAPPVESAGGPVPVVERSSIPSKVDSFLEMASESTGGLHLELEGEDRACGRTSPVPAELELKETGSATDSRTNWQQSGSSAAKMDSDQGGEPGRQVDRPDQRKEKTKERKRSKAAPSTDPSENKANRQRGRGRKMDAPSKKAGEGVGLAAPRKILQRPSARKNKASEEGRPIPDDGNVAERGPRTDESEVGCDVAVSGVVPDTQNLLWSKKVLYLNDLERDLLGAAPPTNQHETDEAVPRERHRAPQRVDENRCNDSLTLDDSEELEAEPSAFIAGKLECFKTHHILPLKKRSGRFPRARFYCHLCCRHLDDHWYVEKHMDYDDHLMRKAVKDMRLAIKNLPYPVDVQSRAITKLIEQVVEKHGLSDADAEWRREIVNDLEAFLASSIPGVKLVLYGSSLSGFGLKDSNINIELVFGEKSDCADVLTAAAEALATNPECTSLTKQFEDRVPRITFVDRRSNLVCELCINNSNSQKTTKILSDYASLDPRVRPLGVAFRQWGRICGLDSQERGTLPPHAFSIMTIYFLQQCKPPVLPVLHELKKGDDVEAYASPEELCKGGHWTCQNDRNVGQLWVEMLRFYAVEFKSNRRAVCIRRLKPTSHSEKKWNKRYIGIEDPYSRKRNLARSIPSEQMFIFLKRCLCTSAVYFHLPQLPLGPLFTALPGPPLYTDDLECEFDTEDRDHPGRNGTERKKGQAATNKPTDDNDEEDDDDDDDATSTSSGVPDLDEQDPELSFDDVAKVVANMDLAEDPNEPKKSAKSVPKKEHVEKVVQFVKPGPPIPPELLGELESLSVEDFAYEFSKKVLAGGKNPPLICSFCQKRGHLQNNCPEQQLPKLKELPPMTRSFMNVLDELCLHVLESISPHPQEEHQRQELLQELETFIRELYKDAKLLLFGSSCNGFGLVRSDLDICLTFESSKDGKGLNHEHVIEELAKKLQTHPDLDGIIAITTAKVPIVKFFHRPSRLEGDISLYNTLAQHNTRLLKVYSEIDERVKTLGYTFKHFAKICDIGDASRGSLSSYAYVLMTLYYLQQCKPPVIPVLQELYKGEKKPEVMVDGWNAWFFEDIDSLQEAWSEFGQNNESVGELWLGMLRFYTEEFSFKEHVVSIRQKKPLTRLQKMWTSKSIAIEDPFDLDHNLGTGVSRKMNTYIMKALIRGRALFGTPVKRLPSAYPDYLTFFFDRHQLTDGHPPNDRGCRACGKIGHRVKECPQRRGPREQKEPPGPGYTERNVVYGQQMRPRAIERKLWTGDNKLSPRRRRLQGQRGEEDNSAHEMLSRKEDSECGRTGTLGQSSAEHKKPKGGDRTGHVGPKLRTPRSSQSGSSELSSDTSGSTGQSVPLSLYVSSDAVCSMPKGAAELSGALLEQEANSSPCDRGPGGAIVSTPTFDSSNTCPSEESWELEIDRSSRGGSDGWDVLESTPRSESSDASRSTTDTSSGSRQGEINSAAATESKIGSANSYADDVGKVEPFQKQGMNCERGEVTSAYGSGRSNDNSLRESSQSAKHPSTNGSERCEPSSEPEILKAEHIQTVQEPTTDDDVLGRRAGQSEAPRDVATRSETGGGTVVKADTKHEGAETGAIFLSTAAGTELNDLQTGRNAEGGTSDDTKAYVKARPRFRKGGRGQTKVSDRPRLSLPTVGASGESERLPEINATETRGSREVDGETSTRGSKEAMPKPVRKWVLDKSMLLREMNAIAAAKGRKASEQISHRM